MSRRHRGAAAVKDAFAEDAFVEDASVEEALVEEASVQDASVQDALVKDAPVPPPGLPESLLVLGGTSEIALATARRLIARRTRMVWLAGRPSDALEEAARNLRRCGADVHTVAFDALDPASHETVIGKVFAERGVDMVLLAFGLLGDQARDEREPAAAVRLAQTNYTGAVSAALVSAHALQAQGRGRLVVLSATAAERPRRSDFIYGSSKAGLDAFAHGLSDALHGTGVHVMVVRPAFVRTRATAPLPRPRLATTPEEVATAVELGLRRRSETVWVPGALRVLMSVLRHVPRGVVRRLAL
jgi:decaprenylphospho-beta-D-erythro-pentofuranosid-2-ulose 2-reductase